MNGPFFWRNFQIVLGADEISARISAEMKDWIRDAEQYDDRTFIVMKVR